MKEQHYMILRTASYALKAEDFDQDPLKVIAHNDLEKLNRSDVVWLVWQAAEGGLILGAKFVVGQVESRAYAANRFPGARLTEANWFAFASEDSPKIFRNFNLRDEAPDLKFDEVTSIRLRSTDLQSLRRLNAQSALILERLWSSPNSAPDEALKEAELAVDSHPNDAEAHFVLGVVHAQLEAEDLAIESRKRSIALDPMHHDSRVFLGELYFFRGDFQDALPIFKALVDDFPTSPRAHLMLGSVYGELEQFDQCIQVTQRGVQLDPEYGQGYFHVGRAYLHLCNYEQALPWLEKALQLEFLPAEVLYAIGTCHRHLGRAYDVIEWYRRAISNDRRHMRAHAALGAAWARLHGGQEGSVVPYTDVGDEPDLEDPAHVSALALGFLALEEFEVAARLIQQLETSDPDLFNRARSLQRIAVSRSWPEFVTPGCEPHPPGPDVQARSKAEGSSK